MCRTCGPILWHTQPKAADQCQAVFIFIAVQLLASLKNPIHKLTRPPTAGVVWRKKDIFLITILIFNAGDATAVITPEL